MLSKTCIKRISSAVCWESAVGCEIVWLFKSLREPASVSKNDSVQRWGAGIKTPALFGNGTTPPPIWNPRNSGEWTTQRLGINLERAHGLTASARCALEAGFPVRNMGIALRYSVYSKTTKETETIWCSLYNVLRELCCSSLHTLVSSSLRVDAIYCTYCTTVKWWTRCPSLSPVLPELYSMAPLHLHGQQYITLSYSNNQERALETRLWWAL